MQELIPFDHQRHPGHSPWTIRERFAIFAWHFTWAALCAWTPKPANYWRLIILKLFGAKIYGRPFVHQRARIQIPWNLTLHDGACLGDRCNAYSLGEIEIRRSSTIAQEAYLCTGTHAFDKPARNLIVGKIIVDEGAFIGARAFVLPGVRIGRQSIVGACSLVTKDVADNDVVAGNPARSLKLDTTNRF